MTVEEALSFADEWLRGTTLSQGIQGWRVTSALLAEEVRRLQAEKERMDYVCSVTRCDPKMDGNHVYFGIGGRPLKGSTLRQAIDSELVRLYGAAKMPQA